MQRVARTPSAIIPIIKTIFKTETAAVKMLKLIAYSVKLMHIHCPNIPMLLSYATKINVHFALWCLKQKYFYALE